MRRIQFGGRRALTRGDFNQVPAFQGIQCLFHRRPAYLQFLGGACLVQALPGLYLAGHDALCQVVGDLLGEGVGDLEIH